MSQLDRWGKPEKPAAVEGKIDASIFPSTSFPHFLASFRPPPSYLFLPPPPFLQECDYKGL
jgi:hypothetical protein